MKEDSHGWGINKTEIVITMPFPQEYKFDSTQGRGLKYGLSVDDEKLKTRVTPDNILSRLEFTIEVFYIIFDRDKKETIVFSTRQEFGFENQFITTLLNYQLAYRCFQEARNDFNSIFDQFNRTIGIPFKFNISTFEQSQSIIKDCFQEYI